MARFEILRKVLRVAWKIKIKQIVKSSLCVRPTITSKNTKKVKKKLSPQAKR